MRLTFLGVRGSTPATGAPFVRYGGDTSCVGVLLGDGPVPEIVLDAGTGLRNLAARCGGRPFDGTFLLTHLHWDHVQGLPFFPPADRADARVEVCLPAQDDREGADLLGQLMSPPAFPITPGELGGAWSFHAVDAGPVPIATQLGASVRAVDVTHKGGRTFGFVLAADGRRVAYVPDHAPALGVTEELVDELRGVDLLVHGGQMVERERAFADAYGHATISDALHLAERVGAGALVLTHHAPSRTDEQLDELASSLPNGVRLAYQGLEVTV